MPKKNVPPFVQVVRDAKGKPIGYRGWAMLVGRRKFGPTRRDALEAHRDGVTMRGIAAQSSFGGTLGDRADEWLTEVGHTRAADTREFYAGKFASVFETIPRTVPLEAVTSATLRVLVHEATGRGLSGRTVQHLRRTLNGFFGWCLRRGYVRSNPVAAVEWPRAEETQPDVLNEVELASVLARITEPWPRALVVFLAFTGLRRAEMARLRCSDVNLTDRVLWVDGKTRKQSHPLPADAVSAAHVLLADRGEFVIPGSTERGRREKVAETFRRWQKKLKEPRLHPHAMRHSVATILLRKGVAAPVVQRFLRHSSYAMTQRYVHLVEDDVRSATGKLRLLGDDGQAEHG